MWFIGVEVAQEASAPPPKKNPGSAPEITFTVVEMLTLGRTSKFIPHCGTRGGGGGGWFLICCSILKRRFYLWWKAFDLLNKMRYILGVVAQLEACDVSVARPVLQSHP